MANKQMIETYRRNGRNYLRLNIKRSQAYTPKPTVKPGWKLPDFPEIYCIYCKDRIRPQAYNDLGTIHLSIGCCDSFIDDVPWPFIENFIDNAAENLEALGFEYLWG